MTLIINNDTQNAFDIDELTYDYIKQECYVRNHDVTAWSSTVSSYMMSLKNTPITSLEVKNNGTTIRTYSNLNASVSTLQEIYQQYETGPNIAFEFGIKL